MAEKILLETPYLIDDIKAGISTLETTITNNIYPNTRQEITGKKLQDVLVAIKDNIDDVSDLPVLNDQMYLAIGATNKTFVAHPRYTDDSGNLQDNNAAFGNYSTAFGYKCKVNENASNSFVAGDECVINASDSATFGKLNNINAEHSFVAGVNNIADRSNSFLIGEGLKSCDANCLVVGQYNTPLNFGDNKTLFVIGQGSSDSSRQNVFLVQKGKVACRGPVENNQGWVGDLAEYFEWTDGNPNNEDRVGYMVQLNGNKIELAKEFSNCIGIVSSTYSFVSGSCLFEWQGKYLRDDFGRELKDENGNSIINPDYDETLEYIPREQRKEWSPVGLIGQVLTRQDGTLEVGGFAGCKDGIATKSESGYRVLKIINENIALLLVK